MTSSEILHADVLDIVFDNRNKAYGAYALRKDYEKRLWLAVGLALAIGSLLFLLLAQEQPSDTTSVKDPGPLVLSTVELPKPLAQPEKPAAPKSSSQQVAAEHFAGKIKIVPDQLVPPEAEVPPVQTLAVAAFGTEKQEGDAPAGDDAPSPAPATPAPEAPAPEPTVIDAATAEEPALFPGGPEAFARYLSRQIGQPEGLGAGGALTTKVRFVIGKDGTVLATEVLQSSTVELDRIVLRALQRSPRWKPARQHGKEVAVLFTLPVTFVGSEE
ncbi:protein TonB [Cnuella takakiae]|uniref:Protein TonB n=1 Tax=Cnuella takakiae TaxID=1302690 RepID=A0A1M4X4G9_9BACT|nr:energy transducer TonB [Cnuella takakiae]OLY91537.1 hypothetical protein BUE76_06180 [Cnuella takakiae]SHE88384.1 protein TonB [Cnuella takakiae]